MFHRDVILNDAGKAWDRYKNDPEHFYFPERITVELTNRCNLQCFMCPRNKVEMQSGDMELPLFKKIVDEASLFLPVCLVPFFRGESLLNPQFLEMLSYAGEKGLKPIQCSTNVHFLNPELTRKILDLDIDFISFSIDMNSWRDYEGGRKNPGYEEVFKNIIFFLSEKKARHKLLPEVQVSVVKTEQNADFIKDFVGFWRDKVDRVRIYYAHSLDGKLGHLRDDKEGGGGERKPCLKMLTDMVIYWNGDVALCNHDWHRDMFIGNVKDDSMADIWQSELYNVVRKRQLYNDLADFSPCDNCSHWQMYYKKNYLIGELYEQDKVSTY